MKNFKIEKYQVPVRRRSWIDCQENNNDDSAYWTEYEDRYRILNHKNKVVAVSLNESEAKRLITFWKNDLKNIEKSVSAVFKNLQKELKRIEQVALIEYSKWGKAKYKRHKKLLKGSSLNPKEYDLSGLLKIYNSLGDIK